MSIRSAQATVAETNANSWPLTTVAIFFVLEGLAAGYRALQLATFAVGPTDSNPSINLVLYSISSVALIVAGVGILARIKTCLTIGVILAALYLFGAGSSAIEAFFIPATLWAIAGRAALIVAFYLQYTILRNRSTAALFGQEFRR